MQTDFFTKIKTTLSATRLHTYAQDEAKEVIVLARYLFNSALSQALYPSLQGIEICLRNAINEAACEIYGEDWLSVPASFIDQRERTQIANAKKALHKNELPETNGYLVSELSFGFWTSLLDRRYERTLWQKKHYNNLP
jgi:hypothetical protein